MLFKRPVFDERIPLFGYEVEWYRVRQQSFVSSRRDERLFLLPFAGFRDLGKKGGTQDEKFSKV